MATPWPSGGTAGGNLNKHPCHQDSDFHHSHLDNDPQSSKRNNNSHLRKDNGPHPCDRDTGPSTSSWPSTELALETPERNRWRYKRGSDIIYSTPPRRFSSSISPRTPKMKRKRQSSPIQIPGKCLINSSPSPLRRFRISQSCSSFTASAEKKQNRIGIFLFERVKIQFEHFRISNWRKLNYSWSTLYYQQ